MEKGLNEGRIFTQVLLLAAYLTYFSRKKLTLHTPARRRKIFLLLGNSSANERLSQHQILALLNELLFRITPPNLFLSS